MYKLVSRSILLKHRIFFSLFVLLTSAVIASAANDPVAAWLSTKKAIRLRIFLVMGTTVKLAEKSNGLKTEDLMVRCLLKAKMVG